MSRGRGQIWHVEFESTKDSNPEREPPCNFPFEEDEEKRTCNVRKGTCFCLDFLFNVYVCIMYVCTYVRTRRLLQPCVHETVVENRDKSRIWFLLLEFKSANWT